jgi:serine/threonine protein kinase
MLLTVLGRSPETRERWIISHAATPDETDELRALLCIAAADEALGAADPRIGAACGPWTLTQRLGDGGQGVVYEAQSDGSVAAVKVLREGGDAEMAFKLERETAALAAIDHPGIAALQGSGVADIAGQRRSWIAMDLIPAAEPLLDWAALHQPSMEDRVAIITQIAMALAAAHDAGVIHRDLKSSNVLVGSDSQPRIIDLGIARVLGKAHLARTHTAERHALVGTLESLAPEQVDARLGSVSERTDIYALGVLAYRLLAGEVPYDTGVSIVSAAQAICTCRRSPRKFSTRRFQSPQAKP